ncbi:unnamed protein product [Eruca vesicaria subsp. sativa]|uniref:TIR domain-containing protein n=1 Tax=Eruca vesicaria subsp. sativa TaxID=29727 RepID=A0ABC8LJ07_ERUVS|nr:unnamed protein product [Eruca vesicaria subsp. sativa]
MVSATLSYLIYNTMTIISPTKAHRVFFNYRGEQLRHSFVSHLIDAFERHGINFIVDKYEQRGKDLKNLFVRLEDSSIALAIFSSRYPESSWCMDELVKLKELADKNKIQVIPIFYKVRARDVSSQTGKFGDNFWNLAKASSGDQIKKWKEALECISGKMGLSLKNKSSEADFIKEIVKEVVRVIEAPEPEEEDNHVEKKKSQGRKRKACSCPSRNSCAHYDSGVMTDQQRVWGAASMVPTAVVVVDTAKA